MTLCSHAGLCLVISVNKHIFPVQLCVFLLVFHELTAGRDIAKIVYSQCIQI